MASWHHNPKPQIVDPKVRRAKLEALAVNCGWKSLQHLRETVLRSRTEVIHGSQEEAVPPDAA
jgi:hypothetical protein